MVAKMVVYWDALWVDTKAVWMEQTLGKSLVVSLAVRSETLAAAGWALELVA